ncbi:AraC-like ligand-binding domain-containing protein [Pseudonocardia adelaidensis]|uniref:Helix-turn-helix domain-containing protein n=1 Tax=Pseudonocardia adelaidensis TaxID=648754 RepID=A0ABP9PBD5_9PSEU
MQGVGATTPGAEREPVVGFEAWRHAVSSAFVPIDARVDVAGGFAGRLSAHRFGDVSLACVAGSAVTVSRTPRMIRREDRGLVKMSMQMRGHGLIVQDGREAVLAPGDMALNDASRPYTLDFSDDFLMLVVMLPRDALNTRTFEFSRLTARTISGRSGTGAVLASMTTSLVGQSAAGELEPSVYLSDAIVNLLDAICAETAGSPRRPADAHRTAMLLRVQGFIEDHLGESDLATARIAAEHHVSVRYVQKLFESAGTTVREWIRMRRIERCRHDLLDARLSSVPVGAIGSRWGFTDPAHFSRVIRQHLGLPPSELRLAGRAGLPTARTPRVLVTPGVRAQSDGFGQLTRSTFRPAYEGF